MKNHEQLPAIDENILDGVAGGSSGIDAAKAAMKHRDGVARAAVKLPFSIAGAAADFAGDIAGAWEDYFKGISSALKGGRE